jgi:hypothetical protein
MSHVLYMRLFHVLGVVFGAHRVQVAAAVAVAVKVKVAVVLTMTNSSCNNSSRAYL